jgi:4-hydroxy-4-methyl-2-oxoglutarate aldolase
MEFKKPSLEIVRQFMTLSTATISDALDTFGIGGGCLGISPVVSGIKMAGTAFTVKYVPTGSVKGTVGDYIDDLTAGEVVVLDNNGRTDCTVWGDILTVTAKMKGLAGTVIDGVCRDVPTILEEKYPIFTRDRFMMTGKDRVMVQAMQIPVSIGGVQVKPGDILVGDDSGVVVVPSELAEDVLSSARAIAEAEDSIVLAVKKGLSLREARAKFGYHALQAKKTQK